MSIPDRHRAKTFAAGRLGFSPAFCIGSLSCFALLSAPALRAQDASPPPRDLTQVPLEKLMDIEVYTPSKKEEKLSETPAAIFVITQDDIRRSGATSIPEALRLVPGLDVAQLDSQDWAISARGFNDQFTDKLLVLQDGRSVYTPLFSGVFWGVQDNFMEDIDRIEVIRGPGASLWGANAVNGVINIITKSARDTQGFLVTAGGGTVERDFGGARFGGTLGDDVFYRVYGKYFDRADSVLPTGGNADDAWRKGQAGFRIDWDTLERSGNLFTLQGDIYDAVAHDFFATYAPLNSPTYAQEVFDNDYRSDGGNVLGKWTHDFSDTSDLKLQLYYDRSEENTVIFTESLDTYDVDLQYHLQAVPRNDFLWGLGYRRNTDDIGSSATVSFIPARQTTELFSAFIQDEVTVVENRLRLTVGAKFEHNDYTGFEVQPSGRLLWTPSQSQTFWAGISRAVRTPSRAEEDVKLNQVIPAGELYANSPTAVASIYGNQAFASETLTAYEIGYRLQPWPSVSLDATAFYNVYDDLRTQEMGSSPTQPTSTPPPPPNLFIPLHVGNGLHGDTYGVELAPSWQVADWWRLRPSYSLLKMQLSYSPSSTDVTTLAMDEGTSPQQQFSLRSSMDLPCHLSFDWTLRYVDRLSYFNIDSYFALDLRLGWRPTEALEFAIVAQNLLSDHHAEFAPTFIGTQKTEVPESVYVQMTWRFGKQH